MTSSTKPAVHNISQRRQTRICCVLGRRPEQSEADDSDAQQSNFNSQGSADLEGGGNRTEDAVGQNPNIENTLLQHSSDTAAPDTAADDDHTSRDDDDAYHVVDWPTDWTQVEVKKLGRQKPQDQSSTNEVHSYHVDLSAYYASSHGAAVLSTNLLYIIITSVTLLLPIRCIAH